MPGDDYREVYRAHRETQSQYAYALLAAAAAAIGFAVTQTQTAKIGWVHAPLAVAAICWAGSFYSGCRHVGFVISGLYANAGLIDLQSGGYKPSQGLIDTQNHLRSIVKATSDGSNRFAHWQFRLLIAGSIAFIAWHVGQMYIRSISVEAPLNV